MIIESVTVRNYRAIKEATLHLDGLTYLVGRNGVGKSTFLNALGVFFNALPITGEGDFHRRDSSVPIEIEVSFASLGPDAEAEFAKYVRNQRLVVTRRFRHDSGKVVDGGYYGVTGQFPGFAAIRAVDGRERIAAYGAVREQYGLAAERSGAGVDAALAAWEAEHAEQLVLAPDDGRFFGYRNVAVGKLDRYTDFVLVPAVRDASADAVDGRDSALRRLVDAVISRSVALDAPLADLSRTITKEYEALLARPELSLGDLKTRMTRSIQQFAPGADVDLSWGSPPEARLAPPSPVARLTDDGFTSDVATKGHGLQRAYMMAALQALAEIEAARGDDAETDKAGSKRGLLLAVEEPELFQHPAQARFIARTFAELTEPASQVRVLACTHSPIFVDVRTFDSLRRVQKCGPDGGPGVTVTAATLNAVASRLQVAHEATHEYTAEGLKPGLVALMNPYINEALFADFVVLVEGEEDKALLEAALASQQEWPEMEARALAVVPVGGKTLLDRMSAILGLLQVPQFMVFDRDNERLQESARWNKVLGRLAGLDDPPEMPETECWEHHAVFSPTLTKVVAAEIGDERWLAIRDATCEELGIPKRDGPPKNRVVLHKMLATAATEGLTSPSLQRAAAQIAAAVKKELGEAPGRTA